MGVGRCLLTEDCVFAVGGHRRASWRGWQGTGSLCGLERGLEDKEEKPAWEVHVTFEARVSVRPRLWAVGEDSD